MAMKNPAIQAGPSESFHDFIKHGKTLVTGFIKGSFKFLCSTMQGIRNHLDGKTWDMVTVGSFDNTCRFHLTDVRIKLFMQCCFVFRFANKPVTRCTGCFDKCWFHPDGNVY